LNRLLRVALLVTLAATQIFADVTYTKSVKYTGGSMLGFLRNLVGSPLVQRLVGADLASALEDQSYTVYVKGSKMAQVAGGGSTIYDLDAGTVTTIDTDKQTFTVETFADLRAQIERAEQWMKRSKNESVLFDVQIENTGQTRAVKGHTASESEITLTSRSEGAWGRPVIHDAAWLVPVDSRMRPLSDFSKRAAAKLSSVLTTIPSFFGAAGDEPGTAGANLARLNGISVLDEIAVTGVSNPLANLFRGGNSRSDTPVIRLAVESSHFSYGTVSPSRFAVPSGYRQEQNRR
jgi:hypothetical protein